MSGQGYKGAASMADLPTVDELVSRRADELPMTEGYVQQGGPIDWSHLADRPRLIVNLTVDDLRQIIREGIAAATPHIDAEAIVAHFRRRADEVG